MKKFCLGCLVFLASGFVQEAATQTSSTKTMLTKNSIRNVEAIYEIRLGAFSKGVANNAYENLKDLGILKIYAADESGLQYVNLGSYMGKTTANKILSIVKSRGYKSAYLEKVKDSFVNADGFEATHTYQFCSVKKLDVRKVGNVLATDVSMIDKLFISYDGKNYQMSLGLMAPEMTQEVNTYRSFAVAHGFETSFLRTFRQAPKGYIAPIMPNNNTVPVLPSQEVKPTIAATDTKAAKDAKMSGNDSEATKAAKDAKMSGNSGEATKAAKDAKMSKGSETTKSGI